MARRINEEYCTLSTIIAELRREAKRFYTAGAEEMLVAAEVQLEESSPEPVEGFNALGFLGCLLDVQSHHPV